jgi:hypothetical protein
MPNPGLWLGGGVAGMVGICCYILAITVPWPETQLGTSASLVVVSAWPILSIIYSYAALVFSGFAIRKRNGLGLGWAIPSVALGIALIGLNAATFPWPPADRGVFDIGPVIGMFVLTLSARLALLGGRALPTVAKRSGGAA